MKSLSLLFIAVPLSVFNFFCATAEWTMAQANISVWLSAATDCGKENYDTHVFKGPTAGFVVTHVINDYKGTQGYAGYLPSDQSIYVAFRGSSSQRNWITDYYVKLTNYETFPECNAQVHKGFFQATGTVFPQVLDAVKKLQLQFPTYAVKVTGFSYGGAMCNLVGLQLIASGVDVKSVITFGQSRIGNLTFFFFYCVFLH
jgi:hypothetical protein